MNKHCEISVLISVYSGDVPEFLHQALSSVIDQEYLPSQIVLVEDGPLTEELYNTIRFWKDKLSTMLMLVRLPKNLGLAIALNEGLHYCQFEYVARMDADDVCLPSRFKRQFKFMQSHPEIDVLGSWIGEYDSSMTYLLNIRKTPLLPREVMKFAKRRSPLNHPTVMFRKSSVLAVGGYPNFPKAQDYALWSLMLIHGYNVQNIDDILLKMRTGNDFFIRRGIAYLKSELKVLHYQYQIGFINWFEYLSNIILRSIIRSPPVSIKRIFYRIFR